MSVSSVNCYYVCNSGHSLVCTGWTEYEELWLVPRAWVLSASEPSVHTTVQKQLPYLIIINVTHISMFRNHSFNFGRNVAKRGRDMERRRERNIAEPKFQLKSFHPSSCVFYGCGRI